MTTVAGEQARTTSSVRKVALACFVGTTIEWYDYFIYGTMAALVFNQVFFPDFSPLAGTLAAFATFAVGFFARPLGAVVFGHFGDRIGRKAMLVITLLLMGVTTFLIGLLPSYAAIGVWAPVLLVALRILQGLGLGGEWGGAALMVSEHSPSNRRGFYASSVQMGSAGGLLLSAAVIAAVSRLTSDAQFFAWGWRIPFLLSIILVAVGLFIRLSIDESESFRRLREAGTQARVPIVEVLRTRPKNVLLAAGAAGANNVLFYTAVVFTASYGVSELGQSRATMLRYQLLASLVFLFTIPLFGALSDRFGRRATMGGGIVAMGMFAFPYFWLLESGGGLWILLAMVLAIAVFQAAAYSPQPAFIPELFETRIRYTGAALSFNLSSMVFGGTAPFIGAALFAWGGGTWAVSAYLMTICALSLVCVYFATDRPMLREPALNRTNVT